MFLEWSSVAYPKKNLIAEAFKIKKTLNKWNSMSTFVTTNMPLLIFVCASHGMKHTTGVSPPRCIVDAEQTKELAHSSRGPLWQGTVSCHLRAQRLEEHVANDWNHRPTKMGGIYRELH